MTRLEVVYSNMRLSWLNIECVISMYRLLKWNFWLATVEHGFYFIIIVIFLFNNNIV